MTGKISTAIGLFFFLLCKQEPYTRPVRTVLLEG